MASCWEAEFHRTALRRFRIPSTVTLELGRLTSHALHACFGQRIMVDREQLAGLSLRLSAEVIQTRLIWFHRPEDSRAAHPCMRR